jgi:hypothetical protein
LGIRIGTILGSDKEFSFLINESESSIRLNLENVISLSDRVDNEILFLSHIGELAIKRNAEVRFAKIGNHCGILLVEVSYRYNILEKERDVKLEKSSV